VLTILSDNSPSALFLAGTVSAVLLLLIWAVRALVRARFRHANPADENDYDDFFLDSAKRTKLWLLFVPVLYVGTRTLSVTSELIRPLVLASHLFFTAQCAMWAAGVADFWLRRYRRTRVEHDPASLTTVHIFRIAIVTAVWIVAVLVSLENLGFNVTTIVAGLGIGGVAVALALQNILGDLFASLSIVIDKPFVIGDSISVDNHSGTVEQIGLKTTRLRSPSGEELIFSNGDLLKSRIRNFKRMTERRSLFRVGIAHDTPVEKLERVPLMARMAIEKQQNVRFDRAHFINVGPQSYEFEVAYFVASREYGDLLDVQQSVNFELVRAFRSEAIELAHYAQPSPSATAN
jgi:small-conductance mechanosensitive channel